MSERLRSWAISESSSRKVKKLKVFGFRLDDVRSDDFQAE